MSVNAFFFRIRISNVREKNGGGKFLVVVVVVGG